MPPPAAAAGAAGRAHLAVLAGVQGGLLLGFTLGFTGPVKAPLLADFPDLPWAWFASVVNIGAVAGSLLARRLNDEVGRKATLQLFGIPAAVGWANLAAGFGSRQMLFGRVLTGVGVGGMSAACPMFVAEVAPAKDRGFYGSWYQIAVTLGILLAYVCGLPALAHVWRYVSVAGLCLNLKLMATLQLVPESPRFLAQAGRPAEGRAALAWLRGGEAEAEREFKEIAAGLAGDGGGGGAAAAAASWRDLARPGYRLPVLIGVCATVFQQTCGINSFIMFTDDILKSKALGVGVMVVQVAATACALPFVDRAGRRPMLIVSNALMGATAAGLGFIVRRTPVAELAGASQTLAAAAVMLYIAGFSLAMGPVVWLLVGEVFPSPVRSLATSLATCAVWLMSWLVTWSFSALLMSWSEPGTFWIYAGMTGVCAAFVALVVPETKGRSLEEIERLFLRRAGRGEAAPLLDA